VNRLRGTDPASASRRAFLKGLAAGALGSVALPAWARAAVSGPGAPPDLIERNDWPEHWETSLEALGRSWITPNHLFFVRSHFGVPDIDPATYRLEITGLVERPLSISLADLRAHLLRYELPYVLECAGNGRGLYRLPNTSGTQWERGAVGNAWWGGVGLNALFGWARLKPGATHVWFEAADHSTLPGVPRYVRSLPIGIAANAMIADTMNGEPLPRLHGAPVRAIVPGWYGMASTKWLTRIRVEATPSDNHFMTRGYRYVYPGEDPAQAPPVQDIQVKSMITRPLAGSRVARGAVRVQGLAWFGKLFGVGRVEVSGDGGRTWQDARLHEDKRFNRYVWQGTWRPWSAEVRLGPGEAVLMARAWGDMMSYKTTQPLEARPNAAGYANNSIHRVVVRVGA